MRRRASFNLANSSVQEWLNYDENLSEGAKKCQAPQGVDLSSYESGRYDPSIYESLMDVPCAQVCKDSALLIDLPNPNLFTCRAVVFSHERLRTTWGSKCILSN